MEAEGGRPSKSQFSNVITQVEGGRPSKSQFSNVQSMKRNISWLFTTFDERTDLFPFNNMMFFINSLSLPEMKSSLAQ